MWIKRNDEIIEWQGTKEEFNSSSLPLKGWSETQEPVPSPEQIVVPFSITMRQCKLSLYDLDDGITLKAIEDYVLTLSPKAQIEWESSADVWRSSPMVESMRIMFGWDVETMDNMFISASEL